MIVVMVIVIGVVVRHGVYIPPRGGGINVYKAASGAVSDCARPLARGKSGNQAGETV